MTADKRQIAVRTITKKRYAAILARAVEDMENVPEGHKRIRVETFYSSIEKQVQKYAKEKVFDPDALIDRKYLFFRKRNFGTRKWPWLVNSVATCSTSKDIKEYIEYSPHYAFTETIERFTKEQVVFKWHSGYDHLTHDDENDFLGGIVIYR